MNLLRRMLSSVIFILITSWLALAILIFVFQHRLIYFPEKVVSASPSDIGLAYEDIFLRSSDGLKLHAWYIPNSTSKKTLLFFHGNAGNISHRLDSLQIFHDIGLSVLIIDYRGYGRSEGSPTEKGTYEDARAAWDYLVKEKDLKAHEIIIFGRSMGVGVATWTAVEYSPELLILESGFTSVIDMAKRLYPFLPVRWLAQIKYPSIDRMSDIDCPVLIIHSPEDELIPYEFGRKLFNDANHPKSFLKIRGGHNDGFITTGNAYFEGLRKFIELHTP